jgi:hypothetical protein
MEEYQLPHDEPVDRERPLFLSITMPLITSSYSSTISEVSENASLKEWLPQRDLRQNRDRMLTFWLFRGLFSP